MKKLLKIMILFVSIGLFPKCIKADCGVIRYQNYNAIVSNRSGASTYQSNYNEQTKTTTYKKLNTIIPYNSEITIIYDMSKQGDMYFLDIEYNGNGYIVSSKDLSNNNNKEMIIEETKKADYYTYEDTEVRSGPGVLYDVVGIIPADTNIEVDSNIDGTIESYVSEKGNWVYVSDGKIKGYIYHNRCITSSPIKIGKKVTKKDYYFVGTKKENFNVEFGTKINAKYHIQYVHSAKYYIEFNGQIAVVDETEVAEKYNRKLVIFDLGKDIFTIGESITEVKNPENQSNVNEYLKNGEQYQISYYTSDDYREYYFIEINGKTYALSKRSISYESDYDYPFIIIEKKENIKLKDDMYYGFQTSKERKIMKKGESIEGYKILNNSSDDEQYYNEELGFFHTVSSNSDIQNDTKDEVIEVKGINSKQYVTICLMASIALATIITIVIILINKKNKKLN